MKLQYTMDMERLNKVLDSPVDKKELQEVFSFVETVTGQKYKPDNLTAEDIDLWNKQYDKVLKQLGIHIK